MKQQDRIAKAYCGLPTDQLAALAFHYMAVDNDLEMKRVTDAVPLKVYRCHDEAYEARLDGLARLASHWAVAHWRLRAQAAESLNSSLAVLRRGDEHEQAGGLLDAHEQAETYLLALDAALLAVCADNNLDPSDIRRMAGAEPYKAMREGMTPDGEMQAAMESAFAKVLGV